MKRKLTMMLMVVVMLAGVLVGCGDSDSGGGSSRKHVEMSDNARQSFIDFMEDSSDYYFGKDGKFSSSIIFDYEINGAPIILCKLANGKGFGIIYREPTGDFFNGVDGTFGSGLYIDTERGVIISRDDEFVHFYDMAVTTERAFKGIMLFRSNILQVKEEGSKLPREEIYESAQSAHISTEQELDKFIAEEFPNAISVKELFSGDNVYATAAELLDAWEEY